MQTSPILNPANPVSGATQAARQSDAGSPEVPFNQVLSREVADRRDAGDTQKTNVKEAGDDPSAKVPVSSSAPSSTKPSKEEKSDVDQDPSLEDTEIVAMVPDDMLALVANISQINNVAPIEPSDAAAAEMTPSSVPGLSVDVASSEPAATPAPVSPQAITPAATPVVENMQQGESTDGDAAPKAEKGDAGFSSQLDKAAAKTPQENRANVNTKSEPASAPTPPAPDMAAKTQELARSSSLANAASAADSATRPQEAAAAVPAAAIQPLQQAAQQAIQSAGGQPTDKLTPRVGSAAWDQALGQKVVWMVAGEQQSASLTLNPPDLGPLQVVLNVNNSQASATFIAAQPEVRQALETAMPKLRDMLSEAGIQLGQTTVSTGMPNQHDAPGQQQPQASRRNEHADNRGMDIPVLVSRIQGTSSGQGLVDTFA